MKGSVTPVAGITWSSTAMLSSTCIIKRDVQPVATILEKMELARKTTITHMANITRYSNIRIMPPTKPVSST